MSTDSHKWFTNRNCEYYPCHRFKEINCLFCFCPLYPDDDCGGKFTILKNGVKDCSHCTIPHEPDGYDHIVRQLKKKAKTKST